MKIKINGFIDFFENGIGFDDLDVELFDKDELCECDCKCDADDEICKDMVYDELVVSDEYLEEMINDYAEIITYEDVELRDILMVMTYELLALWSGIDIDIDFD